MSFLGNKNNSGMLDVIRCDEQNYLVWKWRPKDAMLGESNRENAIQWGSSLRVKEGSVAIFIHSGKNVTVQDYIEGPADTIVDTRNLPIISSIIGAAYKGASPFQAEVYFINLADTIQLKFAVPYFEVYDSELKEFGVPIAVRGSVDFNISDYKEFIKKHRLENFTISELQAQVKDSVIENMKNIVANVPDDYGIPVIHIEKKISEIKSEAIRLLTDKLFEDYGIKLKDINIAAIEIDKESEEYKEFQDVTKKLTSETMKNRNKAKNIAERREIKGNQTIDMFGKVAQKFVDIKEGQFTRHKQTEAEYSSVIEDERAGKIGAIGGKLFRDIGGLIHGNEKKNDGLTPPPLPKVNSYNVVINGKAEGPYSINVIEQMVNSKQITKDSLVWTKGMTEWEKAGAINELKNLFNEMPPIPN